MDWRGLLGVPENVPSQPGFQLGAGSKFARQFPIVHLGTFSSEAFDLKPKDIFAFSISFWEKPLKLPALFAQ